MAATKRTPTQRTHDLARIAQLYLQGKYQADIAAELGLSQQQISYDLAEIRRRWREAELIDSHEATQRELERLDELERAYWAAWHSSQGERRRTRQETIGEGTKRRIRAAVETETTPGNPTFLAGVLSVVAERCRILGLYAPAKNELSGPGGEPLLIDR